MKPFKIGMVVRQQGTLLGNGIRENLRIVNTLASPTRILDRAQSCPRRRSSWTTGNGKSSSA